MNIAFINPSLVFDTNTPYHKPLGGSESALCYLAENLAKLGHRVVLLTRLSQRSKKHGVNCVPLDKLPKDFLASLDILVVQNSPQQGYNIKKYLNKNTKLVLWTQHAHDQPAVSSLLEGQVRNSYDYFVLISKWQLDSYLSSFEIKQDRCIVLKNAIAPAFENLFTDQNNLMAKKTLPPILAYTSTPFRGLDLLIRLFPAIRRAVPNITLRIYSSMKVYQTPDELELKDYGDLYRLCRETEGVEYIGSISQPKLAKELQTASILAYSNTFAETSCISVMEAMASGCQVITSDLGALPETTAGFAKLILAGGSWQEYSENFIQETVVFLHQFLGKDRVKIGQKLFEQTEFANHNYTWTKRALEWDKFLKNI